MDRIWQDAPAPAIVVDRREGGGGAQPNAAALRWAAARGDAQPDWAALAAERVAALAGIELPDGRTLVWLEAGVVPLQERAALLAEAMEVGFWSRDLDAGIAYWDEQMYRIHGRDPVLGPPGFDEWIDLYVHPDDRGWVTERHRQAGLSWQPEVDATFRAPAPDAGGERWIRTWTRRLLRGGRRIAFGMHRDVTRHWRQEAAAQHERERAQVAIDAADLGVWEVTTDGRIAFWNPGMYRLRGLQPQDPRPPERIVAETTHPDDLALLREGIARHLADGTPYRHEQRVRLPDGRWRWLATQGRALRDADGRVRAVAGINLDITQRREADELRLQKERAEQASRDKSAFMARLSHELRTPMNAVLGFTQLLQGDPDEPPSERQRQRLAHVVTAGERMMALVDDLLDLAGLEAASPAAAEALPLAEVLAQVQEMLAGLARRREVGLRLTPACAEVAVRAHRRRLAQAIMHLASHAVRRQAAPAQVEIDAEPGFDGDEALVLVADDGPAYSDDERAQLFDAFARPRRDGAAAQEGTGLGLHIAQALIESMGGSVQARVRRHGGGNEFVIRLRGAGLVSTAVRAEEAPPLRVLYVEDNEVNLALVREMLATRAGVRLLEAGNGEQGFALALRERPDVVLLDLQLPDIAGEEVLRRLRADPATRALPCIAVSANAMPEQIAAARAAGFDDYWIKPIDVPAFLAAIDRYGASRSRSQLPLSSR